jgi:hypothetical protein
MEALPVSETSANFYQTARRYNPDARQFTTAPISTMFIKE